MYGFIPGDGRWQVHLVRRFIRDKWPAGKGFGFGGYGRFAFIGHGH
jgi:hypothetical protein